MSDSRMNGKCIFIVTHLVPYPPVRGVELRIMKLLHWLKSEGFSVVLIMSTETVDFDSLHELRLITHAVHWVKPRLRTRIGNRFPMLRKSIWEPWKRFTLRIGEELTKDAVSGKSPSSTPESGAIGGMLCPAALVQLVGDLSREYGPSVIIAEYIWLIPAFAKLQGPTLKIVDTIDVFSLKRDQVLAYGIEDPYSCTEEFERAFLLQAEVILAIQPREATLLKALVPEREVLLTGMDFEITEQLPRDRAKTNTVTVVASANALNVHGLRAFLLECWPVIRSGNSGARLHIVGSVGAKCHVKDATISYTPWVADLTAVYRDADVVINPTIGGTGLKIKSAQALAHGRPLVAWPNGVDGLSYEGEAPYIQCSSWSEFAESVLQLLRSNTAAEALGTRALEYARDTFDADRVYGPLRARLVEELRK